MRMSIDEACIANESRKYWKKYLNKQDLLNDCKHECQNIVYTGIEYSWTATKVLFMQTMIWSTQKPIDNYPSILNLSFMRAIFISGQHSSRSFTANIGVTGLPLYVIAVNNRTHKQLKLAYFTKVN